MTAAVAATGLPLGLAISYFRGAPLTTWQGYYVFVAIVAIVILGSLSLALVWRAFSRKSSAHALTVAFLILAGATGMAIAPPGLGTTIVSGGSGSVGNRNDATAFWSGLVECRWYQGWETVQQIIGFDLPLSDPALVSELGLDRPKPFQDDLTSGAGPVDDIPPGFTPLKVVAVWLQPKAGLATRSTAMPGVSGEGRFVTGSGEAVPFPVMNLGSELALESEDPHLPRGKAVSPSGLLVFAWSCNKGP